PGLRVSPHHHREAVLLARGFVLRPVRLVLLHGDRLPRLPRADRDYLPDHLPAADAERRLHAPEALRLRGRGLVLALRRRGVAVPVRLRLRHPARAALTRLWRASTPSPRGSPAGARTAARGPCSTASSRSARGAKPAGSTLRRRTRAMARRSSSCSSSA